MPQHMKRLKFKRKRVFCITRFCSLLSTHTNKGYHWHTADQLKWKSRAIWLESKGQDAAWTDEDEVGVFPRLRLRHTVIYQWGGKERERKRERERGMQHCKKSDKERFGYAKQYREGPVGRKGNEAVWNERWYQWKVLREGMWHLKQK